MTSLRPTSVDETPAKKPIMNKSFFSITITFIFLTAFFLNLSAQGSQLGSDIDGESAGDECGFSVSLSADGRRMAIGARLNDGNGFAAGHVRVYEWSNTSWVQMGSDLDGEAEQDQFGASVSFSANGNRLAIGAPFNDGNGNSSGHVRVFEWSGSSWVQLGTDINGEAAADQSGASISLSADGSRLAIGALGNDGNGESSGHVRVFSWNGSSWVQLGSDINGEATLDGSGSSVSLSADGVRLAIGAYQNDGNGSNAGHARVFEWSGSSWVQLGGDIDGEAAEDVLGYTVLFSGDASRLAIGAPQNDGNGTNAGHTRVFQWNGTNWVQLGADINGEAAFDFSGYSLSFSFDGSRMAIGAISNDGTGSNAGHVRVYRWDGSNWIQLGSDFDGEAAEDQSGNFTSLSSDGRILAIGARHNAGNGSTAGHVRVFNVCPSLGTACDDGLLCTTNDMQDGNCNCTGAPVSLESDINADGITNTSDFLLLIGSFGEICTCPEDINDDGIVSTPDFLSVLAQFGLNCLGI